MQTDDLKTKIKALAAEKTLNTQLRVRFKRETPPGDPGREGVIWSYWTANAQMKRELRHLQLAYAMLRGRSYWRTERHCDERPSAAEIAAIAGASTNQVESWLKAPVSAEELTAWSLHLDLARAKAHATRQQARSAA